MLHTDDLAIGMEEDARSEREQDAFRLEYRVIAKNGNIVWMYDEAVLVDEAGTPLYWHGIMLDVTRQKEAKAKQLEAEEEFRLLFSQIPHPTWVYDLESHALLEINETAVAHYGYSREEFLAMRVTDLMPPEDQAASLVRTTTDRLVLPTNGEVRHITKLGRASTSRSRHTLDLPRPPRHARYRPGHHGTARA